MSLPEWLPLCVWQVLTDLSKNIRRYPSTSVNRFRFRYLFCSVRCSGCGLRYRLFGCAARPLAVLALRDSSFQEGMAGVASLALFLLQLLLSAQSPVLGDRAGSVLSLSVEKRSAQAPGLRG